MKRSKNSVDVLTEEDIENVLNKLYLPIDDTDACFTCGKAIGMHNKFLMPYAPYEVLFSIQSCNPQGYTGLWSEEKFIIVDTLFSRRLLPLPQEPLRSI